MVISRLRIPDRKPNFQEKSLMIISLMSNNFGTSKIHYVVVFVDMAGDLGVMVEHRNSPFVFLVIVQSERSIQNCSLRNLFCTLCQTVSGQPFPGLSVTVLNGLKAALICCCLKIRVILSEMPCTYTCRVTPRSHWAKVVLVKLAEHSFRARS